MADVLVVGAGISGLAAAHGLAHKGLEVRVLEAASRPGGSFRTRHQDGFTIELGPNTVQTSPELEALCRVAGCGEDLIPAATTAAKRYLFRQSRLVALPSSPPALLSSPILSWRGKLRLASEPWRGPFESAPRAANSRTEAPRDPSEDSPEETVGHFLKRRLGREAAETLGDAIVQGVYAGDPEELALRFAYPTLWHMERDHGSLLRGLRKRAATPPRRLVGYRGGLERLAARLAEGLQLDTNARAIEITHAGGLFTVTLAGGEAHRASRLVLAVPQGAAEHLLGSLTPSPPERLARGPRRPPRELPSRLDGSDLDLARGLADDTSSFTVTGPRLPASPVAAVALGFRRRDVDHPLDGFGFLAPHGEGLPLLGCLFSSTLFPHRAPEDSVLLTAMVGGRRRSGLVEQNDDYLFELTQSHLAPLLGLRGEATLRILERWRPGIPQPTAALKTVRRRVDALETRFPGLRVLGGWLRGVGIPDCVAAGWKLAQQEAFLEGSS